MQIDGQCLCGHVRYEADIDPAAVIICHCTDCQINSATAFRYGVLVKASDFRLISGDLRRYIKTGDSGHRRALSFCPECGTSIHGGDVSMIHKSCRCGWERRASVMPWCRARRSGGAPHSAGSATSTVSKALRRSPETIA